MKRIMILGAAAAVLVCGAVAYAASSDFNSYSASDAFSPSKAGSAIHPSVFARHQVWTARGNNGHDTAPLTKIVEKIYGAVSDGKDFPKCTAKMINDAGSNPDPNKQWNRVCPKGSLIGQGPVNSLLIPPSQPTSPGSPCNPYEFLYNGGQGVQVDFFTEFPFAPGPQYTCAGGAVKTGSAPAYNAYITQKGGFEVITTPLPPSVSTMAGGLPVYASLVKLNLVFPRLTRKVNGKTVAYQRSIACKAGKRRYSFTFTAQNYQGQSPSTQTTTVSHSAKC